MDISIRSIFAAFVTAVCGLSVSTGALAHNDGGWDSYGSYKKEPIAVEVSPRKPFQVFGVAGGTDGPAIVEFVDKVPDGYRLVMQHVSLKSLIAFGGTSVSCNLRVDTGRLGFAEVSLSLIVIKQEGAVADYVAQGPITLYAEEGDTVRARCSGRDEGNIEVSINTVGSLVGYLVKVKRHGYHYD